MKFGVVMSPIFGQGNVGPT